MQKFFVTLEGSDPCPVSIRKRKYNNGRPSLELLYADENSEDYGFPYTIASVNLPDVPLDEDEILIKDYSENEGMLNFLTENNIVYPTNRGVQSGFVWIPVCILRPESEWGTGYELNPPPVQIDITTGRKMWVIKGAEVWAESYERAIEIMELMES